MVTYCIILGSFTVLDCIFYAIATTKCIKKYNCDLSGKYGKKVTWIPAGGFYYFYKFTVGGEK